MSNNIPDEKKNDSQLNYVVISYSLAEYADATSYIEKIQSFGLRVRLCADNIDISKRTADITGASALIVLMTKGETNRRIFRDDLECAANAGKPRIFCAYYDENEKNAIEKALGERSIRILNLSECHDKNLTDFAGKLFIDNAAARTVNQHRRFFHFGLFVFFRLHGFRPFHACTSFASPSPICDSPISR